MGNANETQKESSMYSDDHEPSVLLPVPSYLSSPHCDSLHSIALGHHDHPIPSPDSDTETTPKTLKTHPCFSTLESDYCLPDQVNDVWHSFDPHHFGLHVSPEMMNTIHRICDKDNAMKKSRSKKNKLQWSSVFGTQIIRNGDTKTWRLKIYPRKDSIDYIVKQQEYPIANVVIGVADVNSIMTDKSESYNGHQGGFWRAPFIGYGYSGANGKRLHEKKRGKAYADRLKVGDIICIELDLIQCNELNFSINGESCGTAFHVDANRNYVLAVSFCDDNYDIQICP